MAPPRFLRAKQHKEVLRTAGDLTLTVATVWTNTGIGDITIPAMVGDVIQCGIAFETYQVSPVTVCRLDVATIAAGAPVSYFGCDGLNTSYGIAGWAIPSFSMGATAFKSGMIHGPALVAGDIVNGKVTVRLMYKHDSTGGTATTINAAASRRGFFVATNIGPAGS